MTVETDNKRQQRIMERLAQIQKAYRGIYKKAVQGKSLRAAVNAQCLDCVYWQRKEVSLCTDLACPLWLVRPYRILQDGHDEAFSGAE
jgi:hypothetical protein